MQAACFRLQKCPLEKLVLATKQASFPVSGCILLWGMFKSKAFCMLLLSCTTGFIKDPLRQAMTALGPAWPCFFLAPSLPWELKHANFMPSHAVPRDFGRKPLLHAWSWSKHCDFWGCCPWLWLASLLPWQEGKGEQWPPLLQLLWFQHPRQDPARSFCPPQQGAWVEKGRRAWSAISMYCFHIASWFFSHWRGPRNMVYFLAGTSVKPKREFSCSQDTLFPTQVFAL